MYLRPVLVLIVGCVVAVAADYYATLGVKRDATTKEIRSAFKKLALSSHPDKNKGDAAAEEKFMTINEAYEVLKDQGTRRKYDLHGKEGLKEDNVRKQRQERHSYQYYKQDFDIYGEDAEIITLSSGDFANSVENRGDNIWFVNFYSPRCSHCHELAPAWRELSKELEGVVRIGAVNCADSHDICGHLRSYPSLYIYTPEGRRHYTGPRDLDSLVQFVMATVPPSPVMTLSEGSFKQAVAGGHVSWLVSFCFPSDDCISRSILERVAIALKNMAYVAMVDCDADPKLCEKLPGDSGVFIIQDVTATDSIATILNSAKSIDTLVAQEVVFSVLKNLPEPKHLTDLEFTNLKDGAIRGDIESQVVILSQGGVPLEMIKLRGQLKDQKLYQLDCGDYSATCSDLAVSRFPSLLVLKKGGFERYHGRQDAGDMAGFVRESSSSSLVELTPVHFPSVTQGHAVIDFYAPWCPPCMLLLPELRKAARDLPDMIFGSVDCTQHSKLCTDLSIRSYPTMVMYNSSKPHTTTGHKSRDEILSFISDIRNPPVIQLDYASWILKINNKKEDEVWFVDYYAPWCGPCRALLPTWNQFAKSVSNWEKTFVAKVDCTTDEQACNMEKLRSYPTVRVYGAGSKGRASYSEYSWGGFNSGQLGDIKGWAMGFLPSDVTSLAPATFIEKVLKAGSPWLVEFFTPKCGPCQRFAPEMEALAGKLKSRVGVGKVDCNVHFNLCYQAKLTGYPTLYYYQGATSGMQGVTGVEIATTSADEIYSQLLRRFPYLKIAIRDEL